MLEHALKYASIGWNVFPCNNSSDGDKSKKPLPCFPDYKWGECFSRATTDQALIKEWWTKYPNALIGIGCGNSGLSVVDLDTKHGNNGPSLFATISEEDVATVEQITQSGGTQLIFKSVEGYDIQNKSNTNGYKGIDTRNHKGYFIAAPSVLENGNKYEWIEGQSPFDMSPLDIPKWVNDLFKDKETNKINKRFELPTNVPKGEQDDTFFKFSCSLRSQKYTPEMVRSALMIAIKEKCNQNVKDPFTPEDVERWVARAFAYDNNKVSDLDKTLGLDRYANGNRKATFHNAVSLLKYNTDLKENFRYNRFSSIDEISHRPPWGSFGDYPRRINDMDIIQLKHFLRQTYSIEFAKSTLDESIMQVSTNNSFDPVLKYLDSLEWDGVSRVDNWLHTYMGADDNRYTRCVGSMTLVAACARIAKPGIKYDYMLILDGDQGIGKSMALQALGGQYYKEISLTDRSKETIENMQGCWIIEVAEMAVFKRKDIESLKNFITTSTDVTRLPYLRRSNDYPRRNIFIGTINPDTSGYLTDSSGNRRFFPVDCRDIKVTDIRKDRNQLFAEAYKMFKDGFPLYIKDKEIAADAIKAQTAKEFADSWADPIEEYLIGKDIIRTIDVWTECLKGFSSSIQKADQIRVNNVLRKLGWENKTIRIDGEPSRGWKRVSKSECGYDVQQRIDRKKEDCNRSEKTPDDPQLTWDEEENE